MPNAKGKGGKNRRRGKGDRDQKRELEFKDGEFQEYAQVLKMLGHSRVEAYCFDGVKRLGVIRGKMHKRVWISVNDIVLISKRPFQDDVADIILKYTADEARQLKNFGEIPSQVKLNDGDLMDDNDSVLDAIEFGDVDEEPQPAVATKASAPSSGVGSSKAQPGISVKSTGAAGKPGVPAPKIGFTAIDLDAI